MTKSQIASPEAPAHLGTSARFQNSRGNRKIFEWSLNYQLHPKHYQSSGHENPMEN
jgi:hypothetical protein